MTPTEIQKYAKVSTAKLKERAQKQRMTGANSLTKAIIELWKPIPGYESLYQVSNIGRIKNYRGRILKLKINEKGYIRIDLSLNHKTRRLFVHRLVAIAFIPNTSKKPFINHLDGVRSNNNADNLEWCTQSENIKHAYKIGNKNGNHLLGKIYGNHPVSKKIDCYDLNGGFIRQFDSISRAANELNLNCKNITGNLIGHRKRTGNYIFKYAN